jgi:hypothetical protein
MKAVLAHDPDDASQLPLLALAHERLAALAARRDKAAEARKHWGEALALRKELARADPANRAWQAAYALALARAGKHAEAAKRADGLRRGVARSPELLLQLARCYAVCAAADGPEKQGYTDRAVAAVRSATADGYKDASLATDPDLAALRTNAIFQALLTAVQKRAGAGRE